MSNQPIPNEFVALKVRQPLGVFFITKIPADFLLQVSFSEELQYHDEQGRLKGSQRKLDEKRLKEIARYIDSVEMAFPNAIIIAANYNEDGLISDDESKRWGYEEVDGDLYKIKIPSTDKMAAIIDGQHRLNAFRFVSNKEREHLDMVCSIFFDLPNSYQAFLFATINGNQKKVDKSLALEQFGFNVEDEPQHSWTPEKLAVFFSRKLNFTSKSPLYHRIKLSPKFEFPMDKYDITKGDKWSISTATIVEGILGLISSNPKRDRVEMGQKHLFRGRSRSQLKELKDSTPLRGEFLSGNDDAIYNIITLFFECVSDKLWINYNDKSYIYKTVGIQALFDLLKQIMTKYQGIELENINYCSILEEAQKVDFSDNFFQASGVGRSRIRKILLVATGFIELADTDSDYAEINRLLLG